MEGDVAASVAAINEPSFIAARRLVLEDLAIGPAETDAVVLRRGEHVLDGAELLVLRGGGEGGPEASTQGAREKRGIEDLVLDRAGEDAQGLAGKQGDVE